MKLKLYDEHRSYSYWALGLGIVSAILWLIPVAGFVTAVTCFIFVRKSFQTNFQTPAVFGLVLGVLGVIMTFLRAGLVYFLG